MYELRELLLEVYDSIIGLQLADIAFDGCIAKAPYGAEKAGKGPVDRRKRGTKTLHSRRREWDIPLGVVLAAANRHDSPLLADTLDTLEEVLGTLPEQVSVHLDHAYDSEATPKRLEDCGPTPMIAEKGELAPLHAAKRWVMAHQHLAQCPQEVGVVHRESGAGHRLLDRLLRGSHHRR
jgi:hypothetical protein